MSDTEASAPKKLTRTAGFAPRRAAATLLEAVFEKRRPLEEALSALGTHLSPRDRAAAHRIAASVLRHAGSLDAVLEPFLRREPPAPVRTALRMGAAELLLLGTPAHAAVAATVAIVTKPFAGLANAVLRRVAEAGPAALEGLDRARLDTPPWLWSAWHAAYGPAVRRMVEAQAIEAPLDLSLLPGAALPEGAVLLPTGTARLPAGTRVTDLPGFAEGRFWVQDAAAALPARLLAVRPGERVADLCAAPGGKTAQLIATGAVVTAVERDPRRLPRLRENLARLHLEAEIIEADAALWSPGRTFDAILLDAPCTASGIVRRHPDVRWLRRPADVAALAATQRQLLDALWPLLAPGGRLLYATCSLFRAEGMHQIDAFLQRHAAQQPRLAAASPGHLPGVPDNPGSPAAGPAGDGFFYALIHQP